MSDYNYGINFLRQWFNSKGRGSLTFTEAYGKFTTAQIETFGKLARSMPMSKWEDVIDDANDEYGSAVPSRAAFNSYFLSAGGSIDILKVVKDGLTQSVEEAADVAKTAFKISIPLVLVAAAVVFLVIPAMQSGKLKFKAA